MASVLASLEPFHAVSLYESEVDLCALIAELVASAGRRDETALIVATSEHRAALIHTLDAQGVDWRRLLASARLVMVDADELLATILIDGSLDAARFEDVVGGCIRSGRRAPGSRVWIYGEMVDILWQRGHRDLALALEGMWNRLAASEDFSLLCGYAMPSVRGGHSAKAIRAVHSHVLSVLGPPRVPPAAP